MTSVEHVHAKRDPRLQQYGALTVSVLIAAVGAIMMSVTSSPTMKGASFLWLPASLQLIAGVWFGPLLGLLSGGLGAYAAGILAYGGWGVVDIIMNPIAGGVANSWLPGALFRSLGVAPDLGSRPSDAAKAMIRIAFVLIGALALAVLLKNIIPAPYGYLPPLALVLIAPLFLRGLQIDTAQLIKGMIVCILISAVSAVIGTSGAVVGGQSWKGAAISVGMGWFLGDTLSAFVGLYILAALTQTARNKGLCRY